MMQFKMFSLTNVFLILFVNDVSIKIQNYSIIWWQYLELKYNFIDNR